MEEINYGLEEMHKVQTDLLKRFAAVCEERGFIWFLAFGSLLGAANDSTEIWNWEPALKALDVRGEVGHADLQRRRTCNGSCTESRNDAVATSRNRRMVQRQAIRCSEEAAGRDGARQIFTGVAEGVYEEPGTAQQCSGGVRCVG